LIATENGIPALLLLLQSTDLRVQRNAAGSLLNLTHIRKIFFTFYLDCNIIIALKGVIGFGTSFMIEREFSTVIVEEFREITVFERELYGFYCVGEGIERYYYI
jgi:hypothetical protein